jgi:hypothetical protein
MEVPKSKKTKIVQPGFTPVFVGRLLIFFQYPAGWLLLFIYFHLHTGYQILKNINFRDSPGINLLK